MNQQEVKITDTIANPAPLGLLGFSMTTILLNIHNAGFLPLNPTIIAMGICYGGLAQVLAGIMEFKKGNTFGATAFSSYGFFWLSLVVIWMDPLKITFDEATHGAAMACYLFLWGLFTLFMFIGTLKSHMISRLVFGSLTLLFFLLALGDITGSSAITTFAGYEGIVCGAFAFYDAVAQILKK